VRPEISSLDSPGRVSLFSSRLRVQKMVSAQNHLDLATIENTLHHLNYRWNLEALALWKGEKPPFEPYRIYEGFESFLNLNTLSRIDGLEDKVSKIRLRYTLIDHYLQRALLPHETEMRSWMQGAAAHINSEKVYIRDVIPWCQKSSTYEKRLILEKETGPLCKFLKPFAVSYWTILLEILEKELGFSNYVDYCRDKKGINFRFYGELLKKILRETDDLYFSAMNRWSRDRFKMPLSSLSRFDAINLLGMGEFDVLFPEKTMKDLTAFFHCWDINLDNLPGLNMDLEYKEGKSAQAMCFILQVPEEVYILMQPEGGWVDLETLWHELGHGLSAVFTSSHLSIIDRDLFLSQSLSESFAFLLQNFSLSGPFLEKQLQLNPADAEVLSYYKVLKDLSVFRRYAAKFLAEYEMFSSGDISNGKPYAETMLRYTGFRYQPECHLFDLVPEFYSLDYVLAWMTEAVIEDYLREIFGAHWIFSSETGQFLKKWWKQGNRYDIFQFLKKNNIGSVSPENLLRRWQRVLG
jgi:hypothetical protein